MAHGLTGTRRDRLGAFAERFAEVGITALVFDHRGFGDSAGHPDLFEPRRQLEDWAAAIGFVRGLDWVDPERVATFGSSMGGGAALAAAASDLRVAAAVSQAPFLTMLQAHRSPPSVQARMLIAAVRDQYLPAVGQPHEAAFINAPQSEAGWRRVVSIGEESRWRNRASARWLLTSPVTFNHAPRADFTVPGWYAWERPTRWPPQGPPFGPLAGPRSGSCEPTPVSTTSTYTTAQRTKPSSPMKSSSCGGIFG